MVQVDTGDGHDGDRVQSPIDFVEIARGRLYLTDETRIRLRYDEHFTGDEMPVFAQTNGCRSYPFESFYCGFDAAGKLLEVMRPELGWSLVHQVADDLTKALPSLMHDLQRDDRCSRSIRPPHPETDQEQPGDRSALRHPFVAIGCRFRLDGLGVQLLCERLLDPADVHAGEHAVRERRDHDPACP